MLSDLSQNNTGENSHRLNPLAVFVWINLCHWFNPPYLPKCLVQLVVFVSIFFWNVVSWIYCYHDLPLEKHPWISTLSPSSRTITARRWVRFTQISQAIVGVLRRTLACRGATSMISHSIVFIFTIVWLILAWGRDHFCINMWFKIDENRGYLRGTFVMRHRVSENE